MKRALKTLANVVCLVLVAPGAALCWLEKRVRPRGEFVFELFAQSAALIPGLPGIYFRRAFYHLALDECSLDCYIGFGVVVTHRRARIEHGVYIGPYGLIGSAWLKTGALVGSRVSLLSGPFLHEQDEDGKWLAADMSKARQIVLGEYCWIGEGAIVMVDVGAGSMVGAGAVASSRVRKGVVVGGNPARFIRKLRSDEGAGAPPAAADAS